MRSQAIVEFGSPLKELETPTPTPQGTEVLIKTANAGVCHSDVHIHDGYFDLGGGNKLPLGNLKLPHTLGHEIEGEVVAIGPDVKGVKVGARYAVYPWIGCGDCAPCLRNEENYCVKPRQLGCSSGIPGGYATHVLVPHQKYLLDYGKTSPALAAAYMCSGLTGFGAMKKVGHLAEGDEVVVLGCGGVGMMGIQFAKALFGKGPIAADIDDGRLEDAKKLVADTGGAYAIVDFVGSESSFAFANAITRNKGSKIIIVGLFGGAMAMPLPLYPLRALSIIGSFVGSLPEAQEMMEIVRAGKVDPIPFTTRPLAEAGQTLSDLRAGKITGRVVLTP